MPEGTSFALGETGATLQGLGAIESDIYMNGEKISTILKEHPEMTIREIQRIPEILDDPVLILKSRNSANVRENSRLVIFGAVKASDGRPVMCVMDLRPTENGLLLDDMQKVASAYTKDNHPDRFVQNSFVLHADEKRTIPLLRTIGFQMPITLQRYGSMGSITYKGPKVNLYGEKFSDVVSVGTTAETAKRKFSASADQTAAEQRKQNDKTALDYFGRTYKWSETGYVLLNGARLDFSGRHEGGPGGYRTVDHRDIIDALGEDYGGGDYSGGMVRFMQEGNIRISPESGGINLAVMPTKAQMEALSDFISKERGEVILDIDDAQGNTISSTEFSRGTHADKVLQAIRDYFENGTLPQADNTPSVSQFRYSAQDGRYRDLMGEKAAQYVRRLESRLVNELAENLSVPGQAKREVLRPMAEEALRSFFTDGQLDRAKLNDLFETAYKAGVEEDQQYIEQYGDLKNSSGIRRSPFPRRTGRISQTTIYSGRRLWEHWRSARMVCRWMWRISSCRRWRRSCSRQTLPHRAIS